MLSTVLRRAGRRSIGLFIVLALLTVPAVVVANHQFPDVPISHPFHSEIGYMAEAGITAGFGDGNYHPADPVTRQAMAAFLKRGLGHARMDVGTSPDTAEVQVPAAQGFSAPVVVRSMTVDIPGATNTYSPWQYILLRGRVSFLSPMTDAEGCPCEFRATIKDVTANTTSTGQSQTFEGSSPAPFVWTLDVEAIFEVPPGSREFELRVALNTRAGQANPASYFIESDSSLTAMTFPFLLEDSDVD